MSGLVELEALVDDHQRVAIVSNDDDGERATWLQHRAITVGGIMVQGHDLAVLPDEDRCDLTDAHSAFIDASSWLIRDPLARVSIGDSARVCWSVRREHVDTFLQHGYVVAEIEPASFETVPDAVLSESAPEAVQLALTVPLHRRTMSEALLPVASVEELLRLTTERVAPGALAGSLVHLARRLHQSGGSDATPGEIEANWSVIRHADVVSYLAAGRSDEALRTPSTQGPGAIRPRLLSVPGAGPLAETPTTVRQFARFVDAGGYNDPEWWPSGLPVVVTPDRFEEQRPFPERPVVGVGYAECEAYCRWLGADSSLPVSLPSLAVWREACGVPFPWGEDDDERASRANHGQLVGDLTSVGSYPLGRGPWGHLDLGGNCWEWLADPDGEGRRVVVGGGWFTKLIYLRSSYAFRFDVRNRFRDLGFRVASGVTESAA